MKFVCTILLAASYLTIAPVVAVETIRSILPAAVVASPESGSTHYKTQLTHWNLDADAARG